MSAVLAAFREAYAAALRLHLRAPNHNSLAEGYELGRRALVEGVSILDLTEHHYRLLEHDGLMPVPDGNDRTEAALEFLLQTMAALDVATRGFLDGTRRYEQQRLRADDLAGRDAFRTALVESLQDGFCVVDSHGTLIEVNSAFGALTGYGSEGIPYALPIRGPCPRPRAIRIWAPMPHASSCPSAIVTGGGCGWRCRPAHW